MKLPPIILVTGTDTGVGKTITTAALAAVLRGIGRSVAVYKPCQSGAAAGDSDAAEIVRLAGVVTAEAGVVLQEPLAPVAAAAVDGTLLPAVAAHARRVRELAGSHDHVLVEGAGGLLVELDSDGGTLADLGTVLAGSLAGSLLAAAFVLVARPALGTLNHTALTLEALKARKLKVLGVVLGAWPGIPDTVHHSNRQVLGSLPVPLLGALPERASELSPVDFRAGAAAWLNGLPA
ncbi:dethiobiotin synthase [Arthrobacter sp. ISL-72]|uniref:dethiobiotin synthase n=1 Tax=Arthrobacter sp. ISL-72 TaxID=2819114 RepID=UPI001BE777C8|nr:dethiobiotin synthase [Arthrobacter sp. ISL-72]MBT2597096.1 dethiobiotin synthase [Arthrobacter sp. ISL-72]